MAKVTQLKNNFKSKFQIENKSIILAYIKKSKPREINKFFKHKNLNLISGEINFSSYR